MDALKMIAIKIIFLITLFGVPTIVTSCGEIQSTEGDDTTVLKDPFDIWPWHVAVLNNSNGYLASGSIISEWFVLTVAHVTYTSGTTSKLPNEFLIVMGIKDLTDPQNYTQKTNISSIVRYEGYDQRPGINDLALLKTTDIIKFSHYVSPICLWQNNGVDDEGNHEIPASIVGWVYAKESGKPNLVRREANVTLESGNSCSKNSAISSGEKHCAKIIGKAEGCLEHGSGSVYIKYQDVWRLRGFVTAIDSKASSCETLEIFSFMDLSYYQKWIERYALPTKHNLLGMEECGIGMYTESTNQNIESHQHPWIAQLAYLFWDRFNVTDCHGVLIHPEFVVTSAKCTKIRKYRKLLHVILGANSIGKDPYSKNNSNIQAIEITEHLFSKEDFLSDYGFDINVLRLAQKADTTATVRPVCLPSTEEPMPYYSMVAWNLGTGHPKQLKSSTMRAASFDKCQTEYLKKGINVTSDDYLACYEPCQFHQNQPESQSCDVAESKACNNPIPGGPLFYTKHDGIHTYTYLAGIRSFGSTNCHDNVYEVFNDIIAFRSGIEELVRWKAWFDEDDEHVTHDMEDMEHTVHFEFDDEGNVVGEDGRIIENMEGIFGSADSNDDNEVVAHDIDNENELS